MVHPTGDTGPSTATLRWTAGTLALAVLGGALIIGRPSTPSTTDVAFTPTPTAPVVSAPPPSTTAPPPLGPDDIGGLRFQDVTAASGLDAPHLGRSIAGPEVQTGGVAAGDYDNDDDMDLFVTRIGLTNLLYRNDGTGLFDEVGARAGVAGTDPGDGSAGASFADVDGDGLLDLYVTGNRTAGNVLYRNIGGGRFEDVTRRTGLSLPAIDSDSDEGARAYGSGFADWDHDGDLDLATFQAYSRALDIAIAPASGGTVCELASAARRREARDEGPPVRSRLYRNDGGDRFTDVTADLGLDLGAVMGFTPTFADVTGDGWEDLLVAGDDCTSRLYRNDEGRRFVDITESARVGTDENGMGSVVEDIDGDGHLDWFVSAIAYPTATGTCGGTGVDFGCSGNRLYLGDGAGHFEDGTDQLGLRDASWGWGVAAEDLDDDGLVDLVVANGYRDRPLGPALDGDPLAAYYRSFDSDPSRLWRGRAGGRWPEVASAVGLDDDGNGKALVPFDLEGDGDLDLVVANTEGPPVLYRNDSTPKGHRLDLRLRQPGANPRAVGARLRIDVDGNDATPSMPREVRASGVFQGGAPSDVHVGLGAAEVVRRVEIWWPGDDEPQLLTDVAVDRLLTVNRP